MPAVYRNLVFHFVWSTRDRLPFITPAIERRLYRMIEAKSRELGCPVVAINGMPNHIHLLVQMSHDISCADFMQKIKGASSGFARKVLLNGGTFSWQHGYGVFSVAHEEISSVIAYIRNQKNHHADPIDAFATFIAAGDGGLPAP
jgi:putative transposase